VRGRLVAGMRFGGPPDEHELGEVFHGQDANDASIIVDDSDELDVPGLQFFNCLG
jgi:hypothetical protein